MFFRYKLYTFQFCAQAFFFWGGAGERATGKGKQKEHLIHLLLPFAFQRKREGGLPDHRLLRRGHTCTKRPPPPPHPSPDMLLIRSYNIKTRQVMSLVPLQKIMFCIFWSDGRIFIPWIATFLQSWFPSMITYHFFSLGLHPRSSWFIVLMHGFIHVE